MSTTTEDMASDSATEASGLTAKNETQAFNYGVSAADVVDAEMRIAPHAPVTPVSKMVLPPVVEL